MFILTTAVCANDADMINEKPLHINSIGMKLVRIPAGNAMLGSPIGELGRCQDEKRVTVEIKQAFYLGVYEVTRKEWISIMGFNNSHFNYDGKGKLNLPAVRVSYQDALKFCQLLSVKEKRNYRLPTEEEWEYACRAGSLTPFHDPSGIEFIGWCQSSEQSDFGFKDEGVLPVGKKKANRWGLYDMHGNASEWCLTSVGVRQPKSFGCPKNNSKKCFIVRGGCYADSEDKCRSAYRDWYPYDTRDTGIGLRIVLDLKGKAQHAITDVDFVIDEKPSMRQGQSSDSGDTINLEDAERDSLLIFDNSL
jgi:formylglycine-generating enzyme required for sulfatase activity